MGNIRPFTKEDIPQVVNLHPRAFEDSNRPPHAYFEDVFFNNPWFDKSIPSLVYEQNDKKIIGFLGVVPRRFSFKRQSIKVAHSTHIMVDPSNPNRSAKPGLQLFKTMIDGKQDLSYSSATNFDGGRVWQGFKGQPVWIYSLRWSRSFRSHNTRRVKYLLKKLKQPLFLTRMSRVLYPTLDFFEEKILRRRFRPNAPRVTEVEINEKTIIAHLPEFFGSQILRPEYDERSMKWLLTKLTKAKQLGKLQKIGVYKASELIGWYIYYLNPGGDGRVLQIVAKQDFIDEVFNSLFYHAWQGQTNSVSGCLMPNLNFMNVLTAKSSISYKLTKDKMMIHSKNPELLSVIHRGDVFLSILELDWSLLYQGEKYE